MEFTRRMKSHHEAVAPLRKLITRKRDLQDHIFGLERNPQPGAVYIHVPFCSKTCAFCNMRRSPCRPLPDYHELVIRQIKDYSIYPYIRDSIYDAVYFGGGTPTALEAESLEAVLQALKDYLPLTKDAEITMETSISELTGERLEVLRRQQVNRISLGVQTFNDRGRKVLGRIGSGEDAAAKIRKARDLGFTNIGMDLIYNYPGQTMEELEEDIRQIDQLDIAGFSFYSLILYGGTMLGKQGAAVKNSPERPGESDDYSYFNRIFDYFSKKKFDLLELTKMVRPGRDAYKYIHIRYKNGDTLPLGAGAGGQLGNLVFSNPIDLAEYRGFAENSWKYPLEGSFADEYYNYINSLMGEIQLGGMNPETADFWPESAEIVRKFTHSALAAGLAAEDAAGIRLTREGAYWGNNLCHELAVLLIGNLRSR